MCVKNLQVLQYKCWHYFFCRKCSISPETPNNLQSQVAMWKMSLRAFFSAAAKGGSLQSKRAAHRSEGQLSALVSAVHTSGRFQRESIWGVRMTYTDETLLRVLFFCQFCCLEMILLCRRMSHCHQRASTFFHWIMSLLVTMIIFLMPAPTKPQLARTWGDQ